MTQYAAETFPGLIAVRVSKSLARRAVVKDVTIAVRRGEVVGMLGPNGAGKTTCFYMLTGLTPVDSGSIWLDGREITALPMYRRARLGIGYLPQEASIFRGLTVEQNISYVAQIVQPNRMLRRKLVDELLAEFAIEHIRRAPALSLSGGERRRVEVARAIATNPTFMLLDEPFSGIDPIAISDIRELVIQLKRRDIGVLITDHNVRETMGIIERAYIVSEGRVMAEGSPQEVAADARVRSVYLGERFAY